ncbi:MAG TPA: DNA mismatch repair endonuclease MutL [Xenococcaceae cyanobacterium]
MVSSIKTLPPEIIDLIAAGEVIDSLAAVVRELVENAIDAKATRITIALYPELWQVRVADNGVGMSLEDLRVCASPHSTSKIRTNQDLWQITSLGFRGEALHSIAQVAELEICSRRSGYSDDVGWRINYQPGNPILETPIAIASGTVVTVSNLFGQLPVRRRGLPTMAQQLKKVQKVIQHIALCHPEITWLVKKNDCPWFHYSPSHNPQGILAQFLQKISANDLAYLNLRVAPPETEISITDKQQLANQSNYLTKSEEVLSSQDGVSLTPNLAQTSKLELVIGLPDRCHRSKPDWIKVAVNHRIIRSPQLEQKIILGMVRTLPRDRYPVAFLHLHTTPNNVDWNRHPAKAEIYLQHLEYWQQQISQGIEQTLKLNQDNITSPIGDRRISQVLKAAEPQGKYNLNNSQTNNQTQQPNPLPTFALKAVAQVNQTYIVAEHAHGLWLVEQHIAHERVLYEQLQDNWQIVNLENPLILKNLTAAQIEQLQRIGVAVESFGEALSTVRNAPAILAARADCQSALIELSWGGDLQTAQVATACRSAIRNGTPLDITQMQNLLNQWQNTRNPRTCPHGRPIYLSLEESALARFFRRHWVIGKSHGI